MILDGHAHACGEFVDVRRVQETLDAAGAHAVVLSPAEPGSERTYFVPNLARWLPRPVWMTPVNRLVRAAVRLRRMADALAAGNEGVFDMHRQAPERILQCYWLDTRLEDPLRHLEEAWDRMRFCMVKLHQCWTPFDPSGPLVHDVAAWCAGRNLPLFFHLYSARDVHACFEVIRARPQTSFILAHCIDVRVAEEKPRVDNLFFDISPPDLVGTWQIRKAAGIVGADHVLLGSDTPYGRNNLRRNIARVRSLGLDAAFVDGILGNSLAALLGIGVRHHG